MEWPLGRGWDLGREIDMNNQNALVKWRASSPARKKMDDALATYKPRPLEVKAPPQPAPIETTPLTVVDLPRICALHNRFYVARYIREGNGKWKHAQTIRVTEILYHLQYQGNGSGACVEGSLSDETCPWCGASGFGAVLCSKCHSEICYGLTTLGYFRCRRGCPGKGWIKRLPRIERGAVPRLNDQGTGGVS